MSWVSWLDRMKCPEVMDCAIVGHSPGSESVWASTPGLANISVAEIKMLVAKDRSPLFAGGLTLGGTKCTVLRDLLDKDGQWTLDIKTKTSDGQPDTFNISIAKTNQALIVCKGLKDTHGGLLNKAVCNLAENLRKTGY